MKTYSTIIILVLFAVVAMAQERTVNSSKTTFKPDVTYLEYTGVAADTLKETNQDTIDFIFTNQNHDAIEKMVFVCSFDTLAGNDSIYYTLEGFNDLALSGTSIATGGILVNELNEEVAISKWYWTNATTFVDLNFRFYKLRIIQDDNNDYDGGASLNWIKSKLSLK